MTPNSVAILVIEDQKFCSDLFCAAFPEHDIVTAATGQDGLAAYQKSKPDIVFLDIGLPDITGFDVLKQLLLLDAHAHVVMLSSMNNELYAKKCRELGAQGFLGKPYQKDNIAYYIDRCRNLRGAAS